jgi:hypothetical protein
MMFIMRAIFWLAVASAFMPARSADTPGIGEQAGRMVGAAVDYCAQRPTECMGTAMATAEAVRIPAEFIMRAQAEIASSPVPARNSVPQPLPRPASL